MGLLKFACQFFLGGFEKSFLTGFEKLVGGEFATVLEEVRVSIQLEFMPVNFDHSILMTDPKSFQFAG